MPTDGVLKRFSNKIKEFFNQDSASIEMFQMGSEADELTNFIEREYRKSFEVNETFRTEWEENRKAYMAERFSLTGGADAIFSKGGHANIFCSGVVADKIEDQVSIQLSARPAAFPLPKHNAAFPWEQNGIENPGDFTRRVWDACFKDYQERMGINGENFKISVDAKLCDHCVTKQTLEWDYETKQREVLSEICDNDDIGFDWSARAWKRQAFMFHRNWMQPYLAAQEWPKFRQQFAAAAKPQDSKFATNQTNKTRFKVCVVEMYLKDMTPEAYEEPELDEQGQPVLDQDGTPLTRTEYRMKYPQGRLITFLDQGNGHILILNDEHNPFGVFPFTAFVPKPISWGLVGRNEATLMRAIQFAGDKTIQQMIANQSNCGNTKIMCKEGDVDESALGEGIQIIPVKSYGAVKWLAPNNVVGDAQAVYGILMDIARNVSGVEAPSEGRSPSAGASGISISLLQNETNRKVRTTTDIFVEFQVRQWKQIADLMLVSYKRGRKLRVSDDDGVPYELPFDLAEITESIDVKSDSDNALPTDPVSMANLVLSLLDKKDQNGVPLIDREYLYQFLKLPGFKDALQRIEAKSEEFAQQQMAMKMQTTGGGANTPGQPTSSPGGMDENRFNDMLAAAGGMGNDVNQDPAEGGSAQFNGFGV